MTGAFALGGAASGLSAPASAVGAAQSNGEIPVNPRLFSFVGGKAGGWTVVSANVVVGNPLPAVDRLDIVTGAVASLPDGGK